MNIDTSKTATHFSTGVRKAVLCEATSVHFSPGKVAWVESYVSVSQELKPGNLGIEIK